jgi:hypothetical protein
MKSLCLPNELPDEPLDGRASTSTISNSETVTYGEFGGTLNPTLLLTDFCFDGHWNYWLDAEDCHAAYSLISFVDCHVSNSPLKSRTVAPSWQQPVRIFNQEYQL